jgi:hypothetical protein
VGEHVDPQDLARQQRHREPGKRRKEHDQHLREAAAERVAKVTAQVVMDAPALLDGDHHGLQPVVSEHEIRCLPGHLGPAEPHRDADVGQPQRRPVVDPVTRDRDHLAGPLPGADQSELLLGPDPREHRCCSKFGRHAASHFGTCPGPPWSNRLGGDRGAGRQPGQSQGGHPSSL